MRERWLARFVAVQPSQTLARLRPSPNEHLVQLRELTRFRSELVETRSTALRRLRGVLDLAFPELLGIITCLGGSKLLALLAAYPTAAAVAGADREQFAALLRGTKHAQAGARGVDGLISAARASIAVRQGETTLPLKVRLLVQQVVALDEPIAELEAAIEHEFADLGYAARDFPVGTPVALATLVAEAGTVHRFSPSMVYSQVTSLLDAPWPAATRLVAPRAARAVGRWPGVPLQHRGSTEGAAMRRTWQIQRQTSEQADGQARWDQAYQLLLRWTTAAAPEADACRSGAPWPSTSGR